jgi:signal transduction histidine kinase
MPGRGEMTVTLENTRLAAASRTPDDLVPGDYVMVSVTDTGKGMTDEVRARAFEPFFTTKGVGRGSGLGLSMVFGFVKQSHGDIAIDSAPGHGTTVRMYFPRAKES